MATKKTEATKEETTALATKDTNTGLATFEIAEAPSEGMLAVGGEGIEEITADELKMPRLGIAQGLSPEIDPDHAKFIDGVRLGEFFNDLTGRTYGKGPLLFIPVQRNVYRIEFKPRKDGGGVIDMDVPANDPRTQWSHNPETGKTDIPPKATTFYEWIGLLLHAPDDIEFIAVSIKTTNKENREAAQKWTTYNKTPFKGREVPIWGKVYEITTVQASNDKGKYGVFVVKGRGFTPDALAVKAQELRTSLEGKTVVVNREPGADADEFDPTKM